MLQRKIWLVFIFVLMLGVAVSAHIVYLGGSVQNINRMFVAEKLPLSQRLGELRGVIANDERLLYEYYSYTATREDFQLQRAQNEKRLEGILAKLEGVALLEDDNKSSFEVAQLRKKLMTFGKLSESLYSTLASSSVDWDKARAILAQVKPEVRQIEKTLAVISASNQQAVNDLGVDSQSSVSTMIRSVISFSVLIFVIAFFVGYYVVAIIREGAERRRLALFAERDPNPVLSLTTDGKVRYANPASSELLKPLGLASGQHSLLLPTDLNKHLSATRAAPVLNTQFEYAHGSHTLECTVAYLTDFAEFHVYLKDVSSRKQAEERLAYQAYFDDATSLPNQYKLRDDLQLAFTQQCAGSLMMIVADHEQEILESFGAAETEKWLVKIALRLQESLDIDIETLYRFGSNAFVLLRLPCDLSAAEQRAQFLLSTAQQPLYVDTHELFSTLSIGAALMQCENISDKASMVETMVQQAASACNRVRRSGGNAFALYDEAMSNAAAKVLHLGADLHHAVKNNELRLLYQPKVAATTGRLLGMEALLRWIHPERGMISPVEFIPIAEDTGLIVAIGRWVLREACRQNAEWQKMGLRPLRVAVNLSARQFNSDNLLNEIDAALADTGLPVSSLELEITESMVMSEPESVIQLLGAIHDRGIHIALDDFGTGHSSLAYLKRFPIDCLKVDRAFIKDTPENADDVAIAKTIIAMAQALGLSTVAEGVETEPQLELLKNLGCDQIQGYFFSRPLSAEDFLAYYRAQM